MFVPIIPHTTIGHTTVVNKTIVYSDTVLPVKDLGSNLKVTSISNVSESSLEKCLKIIFESNPNVIFNTIQYSRNDKKVYFYTDRYISTKEWRGSNVFKYKPLTNPSEILEEIKRVLTQDINMDNDTISLYDVVKLARSKDSEYDSDRNLYEYEFGCIINSKYGRYARLSINNFDYDNDELVTYFYYVEKLREIIFSKNDGDLYVKKDETGHGKDIFVLLGDKLSKIYDRLIKYRDFKKQNSYRIKAINSNFLVNINCYVVDIFVRSKENEFLDIFELGAKVYKDEYSYDCNSNNIISAVKG